MGGTSQTTYRYRFSVPEMDVSVREWIQNQENLSSSLRVLIKQDIVDHGIDDITCRPVEPAGRRRRKPVSVQEPSEAPVRRKPAGKKPGRPPGAVSEQAARDQEPVRAEARPESEPVIRQEYPEAPAARFEARTEPEPVTRQDQQEMLFTRTDPEPAARQEPDDGAQERPAQPAKADPPAARKESKPAAKPGALTAGRASSSEAMSKLAGLGAANLNLGMLGMDDDEEESETN